MQHLEDFADVVSVLDRMPQWPVGSNPIGVAAAFAKPFQVTGIDEIAHDSLCGPFGDTHAFRDIAQAQSRIAGDAQQRVGVVSQERPLSHTKSLLSEAGRVCIGSRTPQHITRKTISEV